MKSHKRKLDFKQRKLFGLSPWIACIPLSTIIVLIWNYAAVAQSLPSAEMVNELKISLDTLWVVITAILVIFMNAGFAMLETGFCRRKNAVNLLSKNLIVFAISTISFWAIGFGLMFGDGNPVFGSSGFFLSGADNSPATGTDYEGVYTALSWAGVPLAAKFLFQVAFAGTAATIISGAVAERIKFYGFVGFSFLLVSVGYPIVGHWIWGGGWLAQLGFKDFAGSTVVHSVGGWCALTGAFILGPRLGKYNANGTTNVFPGHNLSISTLGCLILWISWFGFNSGSTMAVNPSIAQIAVVTNLSAAAAGLAATATSWILCGKPDLSLIINGVLSGLVAITGSCAFVGFSAAVLIGFLAGIFVVFSVYVFEFLKIDDPVGAISVHLVNGIWGTIAVGLFANPDLYQDGNIMPGLFLSGDLAQVGVQILGIISVAVSTICWSFIFWQILNMIFGLRVSPEEERQGLDIAEHGMEAYTGFMEIQTESFIDEDVPHSFIQK
ncbi:MAG: ammonium transporter [Gomphosphaeria aponina SAG 52.96 = DSM 107014]|uniref:Ammonium transporter n=1 Tax=Gomphosphaeria aponina SAG 52.96 = DSM 107014 TaxID=1521640 RepID=A0A941JS88_9CHRO|nr:ammonium transporter [Gomphosphaeria aponina SAG 52.96 = DSM 107014]